MHPTPKLVFDPSREELSATLDEATLVELQRQLMSAVRRVCPGWLATEVEDLVQESMIRMLKQLERSDPEQGVPQRSKLQPGGVSLNRSYLKKIAYSVVVDEIRRRRRRVDDVQRIDASDDVDVADTGSNVAGDAAIGDAINRCLHRQNENRRRALTLHFLGHGVDEVARLLSCNAKRAENLVYRGLAHLRECLTELGYAP